MDAQSPIPRFRFSLRALLLFVFVVCFVLSLFRPLANISLESSKRIRPGMTVKEAEKIIGVPPGWYDGVRNYSGGYDNTGQRGCTWIGLRGEIFVSTDYDREFVVKARFSPIEVLSWSEDDMLWQRVWVRLMRLLCFGMPLPQRLAVFAIISTLSTWALGAIFISPNSPNAVARHGAIGLAVGLATGIVLLSHSFISDLTETMLLLTSPIGGAVLGVLVGVLRSAVRSRGPAPDSAASDLSPQARQELPSNTRADSPAG